MDISQLEMPGACIEIGQFEDGVLATIQHGQQFLLQPQGSFVRQLHTGFMAAEANYSMSWP